MKFKDKICLIHKKWESIGSPLQLNKEWKETLCKLLDVTPSSVSTLDPLIQLATLPEESAPL